MAWLFALLGRVWSHWLSVTGVVLTALSGLGIVVLAVVEMMSPSGNLYSSLFLMLGLAMLFVVGMILVPLGLVAGKRARQHNPDDSQQTLVSALTLAPVMRRAAFGVGLTFFSVIILGVAGEESIRTMNDPTFCGTACHTPMQPEWVAYQDSPHQQVGCVACHVGGGVVWGVKAKLSGSRRLAGVIFNDYARPIPSPRASMRRPAETCQKCHTLGANGGNKVEVYPHYNEDKDNTAKFSVALLYLGGTNPKTGKMEGIHAHTSANRKILYQALDEERSRMGRITVVEDGKTVAEYVRPDAKDTPGMQHEMECVDCHNRPAHQFSFSVKEAVDRALYAGTLDLKVPFARKTAAEILTAGTPPHATADAYFLDAAKKAYAALPDIKVSDEEIKWFAQGLTKLYRRNVFPDMKVTWGTYRSHTTHLDEKDQVGCFRCHNTDFEAINLAEGRKGKLNQDCELCHAMLATDEDPATFEDVLQQLVPVRQ